MYYVPRNEIINKAWPCNPQLLNFYWSHFSENLRPFGNFAFNQVRTGPARDARASLNMEGPRHSVFRSCDPRTLVSRQMCFYRRDLSLEASIKCIPKVHLIRRSENAHRFPACHIHRLKWLFQELPTLLESMFTVSYFHLTLYPKIGILVFCGILGIPCQTISFLPLSKTTIYDMVPPIDVLMTQ